MHNASGKLTFLKKISSFFNCFIESSTTASLEILLENASKNLGTRETKKASKPDRGKLQLKKTKTMRNFELLGSDPPGQKLPL